jgi:hypothetical protein
VDAAKEVGGEPIVAGREATAVLEPAEHALDRIAPFVEDLAEAAFPEAVEFGRYVRNRALALDQVANTVSVVGAVGMDDTPLGQAGQQHLGRVAVRCVARCQVEGEWSAVSIGDGVDLGVATAPADADRLDVSPPLPPAAERCAFTCVLSISTSVGGPPAAASASKTSPQTPLAAQRTFRL